MIEIPLDMVKRLADYTEFFYEQWGFDDDDLLQAQRDEANLERLIRAADEIPR